MSKLFDNLIETYNSQSPNFFMAMAIETGEPEEKDYNSPKRAEQTYGDPACEYCCCSERGCCATAPQHLVCAGICIGCAACCCYVTNGFWGVWTYWPF